jgi:hypothetical protein
MSSPALARHGTADDAGAAPPAPRPGVDVPFPTRVAARYRFDRRSGAWWWSPEMYVLHGLPPGPRPPDTEAYLAYQGAEDRGRVHSAISTACATGRPFTLETRIVRTDGRERSVVLTGEPQLDPSGAVASVDGVCIDLTECRSPDSEGSRVEALQAEVGQLRAAMASRAQIEQAKGILMLLTSCGDQVAFDLLAHISSHTHRKVRDVAQVITESAAGHARLPDDIRAIIRDACPPSQPLR